MSTILNFTNENAFLANNYPSLLIVDGEIYQNVEYAWQASKTDDPVIKKAIREAKSIRESRKIGSGSDLSPGWDTKENKIKIMTSLVQNKFNYHFDLKLKLLMTGDAKLSQGGMKKANDFWGVDRNGQGGDNLGKIIMSTRDDIRNKDGTALQVLKKYLTDHNLGFVSDMFQKFVNVADPSCQDDLKQLSIEVFDLFTRLS